ncbi:hypothetical protein ACH5RR_015678 [Cinchona calisaya]|uniref:Protein FAR1-RELATED SEQUENCE n=1 Tax=Cinchona calisaya TaxID=153742 RepID=A0ABD2ZUQ0_9GENT
MACKTMTLTEFVSHYESRLLEMRNIDTADDCKTHEKVIEIDIDGTRQSYKIQREENDCILVVQLDLVDSTISCRMFESLRWLCRHALTVMHVNLELKCISCGYILRSWTKGAKQDLVGDDPVKPKNNSLPLSSTVCLSGLTRDSFSVMSMASSNSTTEEFAGKYLRTAKVEIIRQQNDLFSKEDDNIQFEYDGNGVILALDPYTRRGGEKS